MILLCVLVLGLFMVYLPRTRVNSDRLVCMNHLKRLGEGIRSFQENNSGGRPEAGFLPAGRIAAGHATWPVLLAPLVDDASPLKPWDLTRRFDQQELAVREAIWPTLFCPARMRSSRLAGDENQRGALGDYAGVAGNGDPLRPWTGRDANGPIIIAEVLEEKEGRILRWRGRIRLTDLEKRGLSYTFLLGEKHVPDGSFGQEAFGDSSIYDGSHPGNFSRVAGFGHPLAINSAVPYNANFGSHHVGLVHFLAADGSVRPCLVDMSEEILSAMTTRME